MNKFERSGSFVTFSKEICYIIVLVPVSFLLLVCVKNMLKTYKKSRLVSKLGKQKIGSGATAYKLGERSRRSRHGSRAPEYRKKEITDGELSNMNDGMSYELLKEQAGRNRL